MADPLFDVLMTLDKDLPYRQNLDSVRIAVRIIHATRIRFRTCFRSFRNVLRPWGPFSPDKWFV